MPGFSLPAQLERTYSLIPYYKLVADVLMKSNMLPCKVGKAVNFSKSSIGVILTLQCLLGSRKEKTQELNMASMISRPPPVDILIFAGAPAPPIILNFKPSSTTGGQTLRAVRAHNSVDWSPNRDRSLEDVTGFLATLVFITSNCLGVECFFWLETARGADG